MTLIPPWPHQSRAVAGVRAAWRGGARRILVVAPTGAGKTSIGAHVVEGGLNRGRRIIWATHRVELAGQAAARLWRAGISPGHVGAVLANATAALGGLVADSADLSLTDRELVAQHLRRRPGAPIQVCGVQTLTARGEVPDADIVVLDEAHHATAATWRAILAAFPRLELVLGLTATPERGDGTGLGDAGFQCIVEAATVQELTAGGYLVPCDVIAPAEPRDKLAASPVDAWHTHARGALSVVFCRDVAHAEATAAEFSARGVAAGVVHGKTPARERERLLADLAARRLQVLCNVDVLTEGWDCPVIEAVLIAAKVGTWGGWMQRVGRALRRSPGKRRATVIDPYGLVHLHGLPTDPRAFSLAGGSSAVAGALSLRQCRQCGAVHRADACPRCGWRMPPRPAPRVAPAEMRRVGEARLAPDAVQRATLERWRREAGEKGWKPGAVPVRFRATFGRGIPEGW